MFPAAAGRFFKRQRGSLPFAQMSLSYEEAHCAHNCHRGTMLMVPHVLHFAQWMPSNPAEFRLEFVFREQYITPTRPFSYYLSLKTPGFLTSRLAFAVTTKPIRLLATCHHTTVIIIWDRFSVASFIFLTLHPPREDA